jgi:tRNA A37 threonylcarbamoyladenosine synthetase subunit TsaC/SUA5/YrdC
MVAAGHAQFWPGPESLIVTETIAYPRRKHLHFFLAAGVRRELQAMTPYILDEGRSQGCTKATLIGRKGWQRTFLRDTGWTVSDLVLMERDL